MSSIDIDGIKLIPTKKTESARIGDKSFGVPVFKISNTKNIPFSYSSLIDLIGTQLEELNKITSANLNPLLLEKLIMIENFEQGDFYIPEELIERFKNCADGLRETVFLRTREFNFEADVIYLIDDDFDYYWEDSESFRIDISLKVLSVKLKNNIYDKEETILDKSEMISAVHNMYSEEPFIFENPIWDCISDIFVEYETFLNTEWQYVNVSILPKT